MYQILSYKEGISGISTIYSASTTILDLSHEMCHLRFELFYLFIISGKTILFWIK
jgi:hypothetical protein